MGFLMTRNLHDGPSNAQKRISKSNSSDVYMHVNNDFIMSDLVFLIDGLLSTVKKP